jgi:hypothetical protein
MEDMSRMQATKILSMRKALGLALLAVYSPFIATGIWLFFITNCDHCRKTWLLAWPLMPGGVMEMFVFRQTPDGAVGIAVGIVLTLALIAALTALVRRGKGWLVAGVVAGLVLCSYLALAACALIRA